MHSTKNRPLVKPEYACIEEEDRVDPAFTRFFSSFLPFAFYFLEIGKFLGRLLCKNMKQAIYIIYAALEASCRINFEICVRKRITYQILKLI